MLKLILTCSACPEQYNAVDADTGVHVGYLRMRHGFFSVDYEENGADERVYEAQPRGDGLFDAGERDYYLKWAVAKLEERRANGAPLGMPPAPDVKYVVEGDAEADHEAFIDGLKDFAKRRNKDA